MSKKKPFIVVDPTKCKHATWPGHPLIDGRFRELQLECNEALLELAMRLNEAEEAAAMGGGVPELPGVSSGGQHSPVEQRLNPRGKIADKEVRELRKMRDLWLKELRRLVQDYERDLGNRPLLTGPRDRYGRLRILSS